MESYGRFKVKDEKSRYLGVYKEDHSFVWRK